MAGGDEKLRRQIRRFHVRHTKVYVNSRLSFLTVGEAGVHVTWCLYKTPLGGVPC